MNHNNLTMFADELITASRQRTGRKGRGARSEMFRLLWENYDKLAPAFNAPLSPNWRAVGKALGDMGILNSAGVAPQAASVRVTWAKVRLAKNEAQQRAELSERLCPPRGNPADLSIQIKPWIGDGLKESLKSECCIEEDQE